MGSLLTHETRTNMDMRHLKMDFSPRPPLVEVKDMVKETKGDVKEVPSKVEID